VPSWEARFVTIFSYKERDNVMSIQTTSLSIEIDWEGLLKGKPPLGTLGDLQLMYKDALVCKKQRTDEDGYDEYLLILDKSSFFIHIKDDKIFRVFFDFMSWGGQGQVNLMGIELVGKDLYQTMKKFYYMVDSHLGIESSNRYKTRHGITGDTIVIISKIGRISIMAHDDPIRTFSIQDVFFLRDYGPFDYISKEPWGSDRFGLSI